jgi:hypothetical protein
MSKERGAEIAEDEKQTKTINIIVCRSLIDFFIVSYLTYLPTLNYYCCKKVPPCRCAASPLKGG